MIRDNVKVLITEDNKDNCLGEELYLKKLGPTLNRNITWKRCIV